jgi:hypothetical protein
MTSHRDAGPVGRARGRTAPRRPATGGIGGHRTVVLAGLLLYALIGTVDTLGGRDALQSWVYPLPVLAVVGCGVVAARSRRGRHHNQV